MKEELLKALLNVQSELKAPKSQTNTFGNYKYRSCEDILEAAKPHLKKNGLTLTLNDEIVCVNDRVYVKATATVHFGEDSLSVVANAREPAEKKGMDASQISGMTSSYARKYALGGLFCLDDTKDADTDAVTSYEYTCTVCGKPIRETIVDGKKLSAKAVADTTTKRTGHMMCYSCYTKQQSAE